MNHGPLGASAVVEPNHECALAVNDMRVCDNQAIPGNEQARAHMAHSFNDGYIIATFANS